VLASLSRRLSEDEKNALRRQNLDSEAAIRIKRIPLDSERLRISVLENELDLRRRVEEDRIFYERCAKEEKERLKREKAQAEARRRQAEAAKKEREDAEAKMRADNWERLRREAINKAAREQFAREQAARDAEARAARQKASEEQAKRGAEARATREKAAKEQAKKEKEAVAAARERSARRAGATQATCRHRMWWNKLENVHTSCQHCTKPLHRYALQCPGCQTIGCHGCMRALKDGRVPAIDNSWQNQSRNSRPRRNQRTSSYEESTYRAPSPEQSPAYDSYDWDY
jgi:hypothetical protein